MRRSVQLEAFDVEISDLDLFRCGGSVFLEVFGWRCLVLVGGIDVFVCFATVFSMRVSDMRRLTNYNCFKPPFFIHCEDFRPLVKPKAQIVRPENNKLNRPQQTRNDRLFKV